MQTNWVFPSGTQRFCENDSDSSHWLCVESSHSVKNVTRVDSPFFSTWLEPNPSQQKSWLQSSHWLKSRYHYFLLFKCAEVRIGAVPTLTITTWANSDFYLAHLGIVFVWPDLLFFTEKLSSVIEKSKQFLFVLVFLVFHFLSDQFKKCQMYKYHNP